MEVTIDIELQEDSAGVLGSADRNLKMIRESLGVNITARQGMVRLKGESRNVRTARGVLNRLRHEVHNGKGDALNRQRVLDVIADEAGRTIDEQAGDEVLALSSDHSDMRGIARGVWDGKLDVYASGMRIGPKSENQSVYLNAMRDHDLTFCIGPAGTGKTYLAVAAAVHLLKQGQVRRLVLVRPAVEAGEKLGFLPGDLEAKVNPYLRPLFDALQDMVNYDTIRGFLDSDVVEVAPLAFMRGRTLNNAVVILDEAQNTTISQMKMFLTRLGLDSKMIVTGDATQIDLPDPAQSGLIDAARRFRRTKGVAFVTLERCDVVRHDLVQRIITAYGENDSTADGGGEPDPGAADHGR